MKKICVMGTSISAGNLGVRALGSSVAQLCLGAAADVELTFLIPHARPETLTATVNGRDVAIKVVNCRSSPRSPLPEHLAYILLLSIAYRACPPLRRAIRQSNTWIRTAADADMVGDIRGGDSFTDLYGWKRFLYGFVLAWTVVLVRREIVQLPQTFGPFNYRLSRRLAAYLLRRSSVIMARDRQSRTLAQKLIGTRHPMVLSPDVAFSLDAVPPAHLRLDPPIVNGTPRASIVGLNVNGLMFYGGYSRNNMFDLTLDYSKFLKLLVESLLRDDTSEIWLIPHVVAADVESDLNASLSVRSSLPDRLLSRVRIVCGNYSEREVKGIIGMCGFFVGSRMHSCIAALSQGIPCVGVAYSMKFRGVFETVGMEDWVVDGREVGSEEAVDLTLRLYAQREAARSVIAERAREARVRLRDLFRDLVAGVPLQ